MGNKDSASFDKVTGFIQKNRKGILICGAILLVFAAGLIVFIIVNDSLNKKAIAASEDLAVRFEELRGFLFNEDYTDEVNTLIKDIEYFAKDNRGLAASRAYSFLAKIHSAREDWISCEEAWRYAAIKGNKTYLAPIALFNAAAAMEKQGKLEESVEYLKKCIDHRYEFPAAPRAQFNIGRLYEKMGNKQAAIEAYRMVLIDWYNIPYWQHFARNKIIELEISKDDG